MRREGQRAEPQSIRAAGNGASAHGSLCGHCAFPLGPVSILGADGTRYHTGCWEAAIVIADRVSALKAAGVK